MVLSTFNRPSFRMADGRGPRGARGAVAKDRLQRGASRRGRGRRGAAAGGVARCGGSREGREGGEGGWKMNQDGGF